MQLSEKMKGTYCTLFFHNSPALLDKPFEDGICAIITVGSNRKQIPKLIVKSKYPFYLRMFFDLIDVALVSSHTIYTKRGNKISLLNLKLLWQNFWLVDTIMVRDCFLLVSQANKNFIKHPCPEKFQPTCLSFRRRDRDAIIARMKAQITKHLCLVRHVACTYAWLKTGIAFWIIICSFPLRLYFLLNTFLKIDYSCAVYLVSFYNKHRVFYIVEYAYVYFKFDKECIDSIQPFDIKSKKHFM